MTEALTLARSVDGLREEIALEREARLAEVKAHEKAAAASEKKARRLAAAVLISVLVALGSLVGALRAFDASNEAKTTASALVASRTQARINTCISFNDFATKHNNLVDENIKERQDIINITNLDPTITPDQKETSIAFFTERIAEYQQQKAALRDCSADAVNAFYDHPTP